MANQKLIFIFIGAQASGKGTQGKMLSEKLNLPHISTGRLIRSLAQEGGEKYQALSDLMAEGKFIPDEVVFDILKQRLAEKDAVNGYILDGYPRDLNQVRLLEKFLQKENNYKLIVFNLLIDPQTIVKRVEGRLVCSNCGRNYNIYFFPSKKEGICDDCGHKLIKREDDTEEIIKERYKIFVQETQPVIDFYKNKSGIYYFDINGEQDIPLIFNDIMNFYYDKIKD